MQDSLSNYKNLQAVLGSAATSTSTQGEAVSEAMKLVDAQIQYIKKVQVSGGFTGASEMQNAVANMQSAVQNWPSIKEAVMNATQEVVTEVPVAQNLGSNATTAVQIENQLKAFSTNILSMLKNNLATANNNYMSFANNLESVYSASANANSTASAAIVSNENTIDNEIKSLNSKKKNLKSAGSIILGIITFGGTIDAKLIKIKKQISTLEGQEQNLAAEKLAYQLALSTFTNALQSVKLASSALETLGNSINTAYNALNDIIAKESSDVSVMKAELQAFVEDYIDAAQDAGTVS